MKIVALIESANNFLNSRSEREKIMIVVMLVAAIFALDYFVFIRPLVGLYYRNAPVLEATRQELRGLRDDQKNKKVIAERWNQTKTVLAEKEKMIVATNEIPLLLENLSKSAQGSGLRIMSLVPMQNTAEMTGLYSRLPIRINAVAGTHEVGKFLAALEGGGTFFKITNFKMTTNPANERKQLVELQIEGLRR
jgi:Tfp pilus assembly protein PilO